MLLFGPKIYGLRARLSLCLSSDRIVSLLIAVDIRLFFLILRLLCSHLFFLRLPHGNLGEPYQEITCVYICREFETT